MLEYGPGASPILLLEWWKPVVGYEGYYEVSNVGNVRRIAYMPRAGTPRILKARMNGNGYLLFHLANNGVAKNQRAHRLVAAAFLGPCPAEQEVNHIDAKKTNNRLSNLEYVTRSRNMRHINAILCNSRGKGAWGTTLDQEKVLEIRGLFGKMSDRSIAAKYGVTKSNISAIRRRKSWAWLGDS